MFSSPSPSDDFDKYDEPRLHMECLMKAPLIDFDLSIRILIPLESAGIRTLGDLTKQTRESLKAIRSLGNTSIKKLENLLAYHKLSLSNK